MARLIVVFALVAGLMAAAFASASQLNVTSPSSNLQAGTTLVAQCQPAGKAVTVSYIPNENDGDGRGARFTVQGLTVGNLDSACGGKYVLAGLLGNSTGDPTQQALFSFAGGNWWGSSGLDASGNWITSPGGQIPAGGGSVTVHWLAGNPYLPPMTQVVGASLVVSDNPN